MAKIRTVFSDRLHYSLDCLPQMIQGNINTFTSTFYRLHLERQTSLYGFYVTILQGNPVTNT